MKVFIQFSYPVTAKFLERLSEHVKENLKINRAVKIEGYKPESDNQTAWIELNETDNPETDQVSKFVLLMRSSELITCFDGAPNFVDGEFTNVL